MSFPIVFQKNLSAPNVVSKQLTDIATATGVLKDGASIVDPVILIDSELSTDFIKNINYAHIEEFGRYYYVTNIQSVSNSLWEVSMHVDVLKSYDADIRRQGGIVSRQEYTYNMLLDDGWFMCYQDPIVLHRNFSVTNPFKSDPDFVLVVAGS